MREISSDSFIGNVLIEYIRNNIYQIKIEDLFELKKRLSEQISTEDYLINLTLNDIIACFSISECFNLSKNTL